MEVSCDAGSAAAGPWGGEKDSVVWRHHHTSCWRRGWTHCARPLLPLRHHGVGHWCYMETATATSMGWVVGDSFHGG
jgi:hypothetical protein